MKEVSLITAKSVITELKKNKNIISYKQNQMVILLKIRRFKQIWYLIFVEGMEKMAIFKQF